MKSTWNWFSGTAAGKSDGPSTASSNAHAAAAPNPLGTPSTSDNSSQLNIIRQLNVITTSGGPGSRSGGLIPPTLLDDSRVPASYRRLLISCGASLENRTSKPNTAAVHTCILRSGLPRDALASIWSAVARTNPTQLTRAEFFSCLALIALAQRGEDLTDLSSMSLLPEPELAADTPSVEPPPSQESTKLPQCSPGTGLAYTSFPPPARPHGASGPVSSTSFVPASLLGSQTPQVDLLGDELGTDSTTAHNHHHHHPSPHQLEIFRRAIDSCHAMLTAGAALSLEKGAKETMEVEEGERYWTALSRVALVAVRLQSSLAGHDSALEAKIRDVLKQWTTVADVLKLTIPSEETSDTANTAECCTVCGSSATAPTVIFGPSSYHAECANLWLHTIHSILPT